MCPALTWPLLTLPGCADLQMEPGRIMAAFSEVLQERGEALAAAGKAQLVQRTPYALWPRRDAVLDDGCFRPVASGRRL